jgi:diadenosine tetraphosphate (Ap4A) HIT family hydrolase
MNATMRKFGYPDTLIKELDHWDVLLRPAQVTLGSLVLAAKSEATAYSGLPDGAFAEQALAVRSIETALRSFCDFERINYLMLMMVDPNVHFHVIPRYADSRRWDGIDFPDTGWPGPPELKSAAQLGGAQIKALSDQLKPHF